MHAEVCIHTAEINVLTVLFTHEIFHIQVVRAVSSLLTRQCHLRSADMVDCLFSLDDGLQVLKALAFNVEQRPTKNSLCRLRLDGFFDVQQNFDDVSLATFVDVTKSFQSLCYICLDKVCGIALV